jgi:hypothetical protein
MKIVAIHETAKLEKNNVKNTMRLVPAEVWLWT